MFYWLGEMSLHLLLRHSQEGIKKNKKTLSLYAHSSTAVLSLRSETSEVSEQHHSLLEVLCHKQKRNDKFSSGYPLLTECAVAVLATDQCC